MSALAPEPAERGDTGDDDAGRDWNALLERVLEPFRSEAAAFRVLVGTIAIFGTIILLIVLIRLIT